MSEAVNISIEDNIQQYTRTTFFLAGQDDFATPPAQNPDSFTALNNVIPGVKARLMRRWGSTLFSSPGMIARRIFEAHFINGRNRFILTARDASGVTGLSNNVLAINENGTVVTATPIIIPASSTDGTPPQVEVSLSRNYAFFSDGATVDLRKWDTEDDPTTSTVAPDTGASIPSVTLDGIEEPTTAPTASATAEGTGNIYLIRGRSYTIAFRNSLSGQVSHIGPFVSGLGITSDPTDPATGVTVDLSVIEVSTDPQVDERVILATSDGGAQDTLYEVGILLDNSTTTFTDTKSEAELINSDIWAELGPNGEQKGLIGNTSIRTVAPTTTITCLHRGRRYALQGHFLFRSKCLADVATSTNNVAGRWEECWPIENQTSISGNGSEIGTCLRSDDVNLYIGTNRATYIMHGDNVNFEPPSARFHEAGVLNNAAWSIIYHQGKAAGAVWLTPDRRLIYSDFNTYDDAGNPIQTTLTALGDVEQHATSTFVADGPFELYILGPGTASSPVIVANAKTQKWAIWFGVPSDEQLIAVGYMYDSNNARALPVFSTSTGKVFRWNKDTTRDDSSGANSVPPVSLETVWLDFDNPLLTKCLNLIEVQTAAPDLTVSIYGANSESEFDAETLIGTRSFVTTDFGTLAAKVADLRTAHRFYKFIFANFDGVDDEDILSYLSIEYQPFAMV